MLIKTVTLRLLLHFFFNKLLQSSFKIYFVDYTNELLVDVNIIDVISSEVLVDINNINAISYELLVVMSYSHRRFLGKLPTTFSLAQANELACELIIIATSQDQSWPFILTQARN